MFRMTGEPIDAAGLARDLDQPDGGALVVFEGRVRRHNEGRTVQALEYEAYTVLAEREGQRILQEAGERFPLLECRCWHRAGRLEIGGIAVWVGVLSEHRGEAFAACRYIIDQVKHRVPIWKKEFYQDGDSGWVRCEHGAHPHTHDPASEGTPQV
jgi:molybdopterin synthase catalytic subunit